MVGIYFICLVLAAVVGGKHTYVHLITFSIHYAALNTVHVP